MAASALEKRRQRESLASTLRAGQRIALKGNGSERPVFIHDRAGEIKVGNVNVVVWEAPQNPQA